MHRLCAVRASAAAACRTTTTGNAARHATSAAHLASSSRTRALALATAARTIVTRHFSAAASSSSSSAAAASGSDLANEFAALWDDASGTGGETTAADATLQQTVGEVLSATGGIVAIDGLRSAHVGACVEFFDPKDPSSVIALGLVLSIHSDFCRALLLDSGAEELVASGCGARHTRGHVPALDVNQMSSWAGQLIDPLGRVLDPHSMLPVVARLPKALIIADAAVAGESDVTPPPAASVLPLLTLAPPSLASRSTQHRFLPTGFVHIDAFHPLAQGLRVGLMGAKRTGKTALAAAVLGSFSKQRKQHEATRVIEEEEDEEDASLLPEPLHYVYVSVGQSRADVRALVDRLQRNGSMANTTIVVATQETGLGLQYLAPFMGQTLADAHVRAGECAFVVFDDLSAHGQVLTTINRVYGAPLLAPNFVHARLLERTAPLDGGASSTALVLVETHRADRALEVNENLSGFVDHAIWLDANLAAQGAFPAINVASVLGRPAARYRPHVLRALSNTLSAQLLASARTHNTARWAAEFGLEAEEDDRPLREFKDKVQAIMSQRLDEPLMTPTEQLLVLYALQRDAAMLAHVEIDHLAAYQRELLRTLRDASVPEHVELFAEVERAVNESLRRDGNSTQGAESEQAELALEPQAQEEASVDAPAVATSLTAAQMTQSLWPRVDEILDRFQVDFINKYTR